MCNIETNNNPFHSESESLKIHEIEYIFLPGVKYNYSILVCIDTNFHVRAI